MSAQLKPTALLALGLMAFSTSAICEGLNVVGFGGSIAEVQKVAIFDPFTAETGIAIIQDEWGGEIAKVRVQVESGAVTWDVLQVEGAELQVGCAEGLYVPLDWSKIGDRADFLPLGNSECGLGAVGSASILMYDGEKIAEGPETWADFWDVAKWPGLRGMRNSPKETLEIALLADGVSPADIYTVLGTPEGMDRAYAKLDELKPNILWWSSGAESIQRLASAEVVMSTAWNGRPFLANKNDGRDFRIVWEAGGIVAMDNWVILNGSPKVESAYSFLAFAARPDIGAAFMKGIPYGVGQTGAYELLTEEERGQLPSSPANMQASVTTDQVFWVDNLDSIQQRFDTWKAQ